MEQELRKHAETLRRLADALEEYAPVSAELQGILKKMDTPGQKAARKAQEAQDSSKGKIRAQPNQSGQLPSTAAEFGEQRKRAA